MWLYIHIHLNYIDTYIYHTDTRKSMSKQISTKLTNYEMKRVDDIINAGFALNRSDFARNVIRTELNKRAKNKNGGV